MLSGICLAEDYELSYEDSKTVNYRGEEDVDGAWVSNFVTDFPESWCDPAEWH